MNQQPPSWYTPPAGGVPSGQRYSYQPEYGQGYGYLPPSASQPSNGMAIASLVLSILWFAGIGSLLAVIFGTKARRAARRAGTTSGLGTAGLIIGIIGLVGGVLFWALIVAIGVNVHKALEIHHLQPGQTATLPSDTYEGVKSVTVYGVTFPVKSQDPVFTSPDAGREFAVADVRVCAGPTGIDNGANIFDFDLLFGSETVSPTFGSIRNPAITDSTVLAANQCTRGYVGFEIPANSTPSGVRYGVGFDTTNRFQWPVNGSSQ